jgi:uncharacterized protein (DUF1499 family)
VSFHPRSASRIGINSTIQRYDRGVAGALTACVVSVLGLVLLALAGPLYRIGLLALASSFELMRWAAYVGIGGMAIGLIAGAIAYFQRRRGPQLLAGLGFVAGLVAVGIPFQLQRQAQNVPPIHDVSTDLENPPAFEAVLPLRTDAVNPLDRSPELARQQRQGYPDVAPITLPTSRDQTFDKALAAAQSEGWDIVTADKASGRIEATDTSRWFGFTDDIVVRLTAWGSGTRVDMRSVSRVGRGDLGSNARRIRRYFEKLQAG